VTWPPNELHNRARLRRSTSRLAWTAPRSPDSPDNSHRGSPRRRRRRRQWRRLGVDVDVDVDVDDDDDEYVDAYVNVTEPMLEGEEKATIAELGAQIRTEVEAYMSGRHVIHNSSRLRMLIASSPGGWVPVHVLAGSTRLQEITGDSSTIISALRDQKSEVVELHTSGKFVRRRKPLPLAVSSKSEAWIQEQVEYFFGDRYLLSHAPVLTQLHDEGWVPLSTVAEWRKLNRMRVKEKKSRRSSDILKRVLNRSSLVEVDWVGDRVRRRIPLPLSRGAVKTSSYLSAGLGLAESAAYKAAGVLAWRLHGGEVQILMGIDKVGGSRLNFLGGIRDRTDVDAAYTAVREFFEESGSMMTEEMKSQMLAEFRQSPSISTPRDPAVSDIPSDHPNIPVTATKRKRKGMSRVMWFAMSQYAMYFYKWPYFDLTPAFNRKPKGEMEELMWVPLRLLLHSPTDVTMHGRTLPLRGFSIDVLRDEKMRQALVKIGNKAKSATTDDTNKMMMPLRRQANMPPPIVKQL